MLSNDLRINNIVVVKNYNSKYYNKIGRIEGFTRNAEYVSLDINQDSAFYLKDIEPIILTHELLIDNCGFTQRRCQFTLSVGGESLDYFEHESGFILWYHGKRLGYAKNQVVRNQINPKEQFYNTIHDLQNLFWVMKKQELEINL